MSKNKSNMYQDRKYNWGCFVGCEFDCLYCKRSFQAQIKRWTKPRIDRNGEKRGCEFCYKYIPHVHEERLLYNYCKKNFPKTNGDEFIWVGQNGDISFIPDDYVSIIFQRIREFSDKTFFFQTKNPKWYKRWELFPENVILGITLETDIWRKTYKLSKAPVPSQRVVDFQKINHKRKSITIEPILKFNIFDLVDMCEMINPERIYIGYDSKHNKLSEPSLLSTKQLIEDLKETLLNCKIKEKLIRHAWWEI